MASLELRNGIWHIRYRDRRGKDRAQSTKLHTSPQNDILARKKLQSFEVDLMRGREPLKAAKIGGLLDDVKNDHTSNAKKAKVTTLLRIENHLRPWFGEMRVDRFGADDIREYQAMRQEHVENATINRELAILRRGFALAYEAGKLPNVPYFPKLKEAGARNAFLERSELERLCDCLPQYLASPTRFAFLTGWRLGEIRGLEWRHVSFERQEIRLDIGSTKNGDGRVFPMTAELRILLTAIQPPAGTQITAVAARKSAVVPAPVAALAQVFVRKLKSGSILPLGDIRKAWANGIKKAGLPCVVNMQDGSIDVGELVFHSLRASAIIEMDQRGVPVKVIMALTGHKTIEMFLRYRKVGKRDMDTARKLMEGH